MKVVKTLGQALNRDVLNLVQDAQTVINEGAAIQYEGKISQGTRLKGISAKITHFSGAAVAYKAVSTVPASKLVQPALLAAALGVCKPKSNDNNPADSQGGPPNDTP